MINLSLHGVTRIERRNRKHNRYEDKYFYTTEFVVYFKTWDDQEYAQNITLFGENPMEIEDADCTSPVTQDV